MLRRSFLIRNDFTVIVLVGQHKPTFEPIGAGLLSRQRDDFPDAALFPR